jgi:hypothetical protein
MTFYLGYSRPLRIEYTVAGYGVTSRRDEKKPDSKDDEDRCPLASPESRESLVTKEFKSYQIGKMFPSDMHQVTIAIAADTLDIVNPAFFRSQTG